MSHLEFVASAWTVCLFILHAVILARAILRPHREPSSRLAWVVVIAAVPLLGIVAYLLFGETNLGRRREDHIRRINRHLPRLSQLNLFSPVNNPTNCLAPVPIPPPYDQAFRLGYAFSHFHPIGGNQAKLLDDTAATIDSLVADIDAALSHVHLLFYIWLPDHNGRKIIDALHRAASRKVACRVIADGLGSRILIKSTFWTAMRSAGIQAVVALPIGSLLHHLFRRRVDLRNHRKIVVIDNQITYCGSQNCADPEFLIKAKFAPWVDIMVRFTGPVALQNQRIFIADWMAHIDEDLAALLEEPLAPTTPGITAQAIGTGPTLGYSAMPEIFEMLIFTARTSLTISTPYFVPNESMLAALCGCARRGVKTTMIFPARNDSWVVGAASRSYYAALLGAGVEIFEYHPGLLHAKTLTIDGDLTLVGSANLDRRSFDLNYENNLLVYDPTLTRQIRERQQSYINDSTPITTEFVAQWSIARRLLNNSIAILGPML